MKHRHQQLYKDDPDVEDDNSDHSDINYNNEVMDDIEKHPSMRKNHEHHKDDEYDEIPLVSGSKTTGGTRSVRRTSSLTGIGGGYSSKTLILFGLLCFGLGSYVMSLWYNNNSNNGNTSPAPETSSTSGDSSSTTTSTTTSKANVSDNDNNNDSDTKMKPQPLFPSPPASKNDGDKNNKNNKNNSNNNNNNKQSPVSVIPSEISQLRTTMQISTWNIAAINNNPFEYWITYDENPDYEQLMISIENFLENPGSHDVVVSEVFTESMFTQLETFITTTAGWVSPRSYWENDFSKRTIITGFMKDSLLGLKRLASMPDRITNTMNTADNQTYYRPTVINMFEDDLSSMDLWWQAWSTFMFQFKMKIENTDGIISDMIPYQLLQPIKKSKYPAILPQEEIDSLPLQTLCCAIFDAILVHMMNSLSNNWQDLKHVLIENLNKKKIPHTIQILEQQYYVTSDIITLQEVSNAFIDIAESSTIFGSTFTILKPAEIDLVRDQNSIICLNKASFPNAATTYVEITSLVEAEFIDKDKVPVAPGDIFAIVVYSNKNDNKEAFVIASFHGDTNGLATKPVIGAIVAAMKNPKNSNSIPTDAKLIFGLDANTYEHGDTTKQDVLDFSTFYLENNLTSCWGDIPNPSNYTTFNARTYLQPQLNKACKSTEKRTKGDVNPKDFILFNNNNNNNIVQKTWKDNTGKAEYIEDMAFPTLDFPSDHGILSTIIEY